MHYDIRVSPNRRSKMSVQRYSKSVMKKFFFLKRSTRKVHSLHHATRREDPQHRVHVRVVLFDRCVQRSRQIFAGVGFDVETLRKPFQN